MKRRYMIRIAWLGLSAAGLAACGGATSGNTPSPSSGARQPIGSLVIAQGTNVDTLDPAAQVTLAVYPIVMQMVEELTKQDPDGSIKPQLATSWQMGSDGKSWTFTLRPNVKFSDGEAFNANAVKFSIDRLLSPTTYKAKPSTLTVIKDTVVVDPMHVRFDLKSVYTALPNLLALPAAGIIAPNSVNVAPNSMAKVEQPVGTGPYVFNQFVPGDNVTLTANPHYWGGEPAYETMVWKVVPSAASRQALLESGGANIVVNPPASALPSLEQNSQYKVVQTPAPNLIMLGLEEQNQPLLKNPQVRQALNLAIDRSSIINKLADGAGAMPIGPISSAMNGSCKTGTYTYDPTKAKQLLQQAGATGMTLSMVAPSGRYLNDYQIGQAIASEFQAVGVNATLANPTDFATYLAQIYAPKSSLNFDAYMIGLGDPSLTASAALGNFLPDQEPPQGYNAVYYDNPQFATLVHEADGTLDQSQRNDLYCQAQKVLWNDAPALWLYELKVPVVMNANLTGLRGLPSGVIDPTWVSPS